VHRIAAAGLLLCLPGLVGAGGAVPARENGPIAARFGPSIYLLEQDGSERRRLPAVTGAVDLAWSADGTRLALTRGRSPGAIDLYVAGRDGRGARLLVRNAESPSWAPDGRRIVFMRFVCPGGSCPELENPYELFTVTVEGGSVRRLTRNRDYDGQPDWSPNGSTIVFERADGLFLIDPNGRSRRRLTRGYHQNPDWAPEGARIAFDNLADVYILTEEQGRARRLTRNPGPDFAPEWSPDGRRIAYLSNPVCARGGGCTAHEPLLIRTSGPVGGRPTSITPLGWGPPHWLPRQP
jgi:Tol biopolymer transport system component